MRIIDIFLSFFLDINVGYLDIRLVNYDISPVVRSDDKSYCMGVFTKINFLCDIYDTWDCRIFFLPTSE